MPHQGAASPSGGAGASRTLTHGGTSLAASSRSGDGPTARLEGALGAAREADIARRTGDSLSPPTAPPSSTRRDAASRGPGRSRGERLAPSPASLGPCISTGTGAVTGAYGAPSTPAGRAPPRAPLSTPSSTTSRASPPDGRTSLATSHAPTSTQHRALTVTARQGLPHRHYPLGQGLLLVGRHQRVPH